MQLFVCVIFTGRCIPRLRHLLCRNLKLKFMEKGKMDVEAPICHCRKPSKLMTSLTDENPGRRFWGCDGYGRNGRRGGVGCCNFFEWCDPKLTQESGGPIPGLLKKLKMKDDEIVYLKKEIKGGVKRQRCLIFVIGFSWMLVLLFLGMVLGSLGRKDRELASKSVNLALEF